MGQKELGAALLHYLEDFPSFPLDMTSLVSDQNYAGMEGLLQVQIIARDNLDNTSIYLNNPEED
jgi:hypothetical protein